VLALDGSCLQALFVRSGVLVDPAVMVADGGHVIADIDVLRHQQEVFGSVARPATCWPTLDEIGPAQLRRIAKAGEGPRPGVGADGQAPAARTAGRDLVSDTDPPRSSGRLLGRVAGGGLVGIGRRGADRRFG
jgi:hypothetical protein